MALLLPALLLPLLICQGVSGGPEDVKKLSSASNDFGFKLLEKIGSEGNLIVSPTSIFIALSMLYEGAKGTTAQEMRQALSLSDAGVDEANLNQNIKDLISSVVSSSDQYVLDISNALLSRIGYPVQVGYKEIAQTYYNAILREVDFANDAGSAVEEINNWVNNKTHGNIPTFLDGVNPSTILVLLNAAYFKSAWEVEFSSSNIRNGTFFNGGVDPVRVPMMSGRERMQFWEDERSQALKLPYKGKKLNMILVLPSEKNGLSSLERELNSAKLEEIVSNMESVFVTTNIPKFKLEYSKELEDMFRLVGMNTVFTSEGDLSGISEERGLKVSKVIHKAYLEVNEEGSQSAGATGIEVIPGSFPRPKRHFFYADHPFLIFIRDEETGLILFSGRVNEL